MKAGLFSILLCAGVAQGYWFHDITPRSYHKGEILDIHAGQLFSQKSAYPFDFYKLAWCPNTKGVEWDPDSVGKAIRDVELVESPYQYEFGDTEKFISCQKKVTATQRSQFSTMIQHGFRYHLYLDDLPSVTIMNDEETGFSYPDYQEGIPIGEYNPVTKELIIYNHLVITVKTHFAGGTNGQRIVGFEVEPRSVHKDSFDRIEKEWDVDLPKAILTDKEEIIFSYSVYTVVSISNDFSFNSNLLGLIRTTNQQNGHIEWITTGKWATAKSITSRL